MAAMLRDFIVLACSRPRAIPLPVFTMKKEKFMDSYEYEAPIDGPSGHRTSSKITPALLRSVACFVLVHKFKCMNKAQTKQKHRPKTLQCVTFLSKKKNVDFFLYISFCSNYFSLWPLPLHISQKKSNL